LTPGNNEAFYSSTRLAGIAAGTLGTVFIDEGLVRIYGAGRTFPIARDMSPHDPQQAFAVT
jgi:hypothetical protein